MTLPIEVSERVYYLWRLEIEPHADIFIIKSYNCFDAPLEKEVAMSACETLANLEGYPGKTHFEALPAGQCPGCTYWYIYEHTKECSESKAKD